MIEWDGNLINSKEVLCVKYQTYYADVYGVAYGGGQPSVYIFLKSKSSPLIFSATKEKFEQLKELLKRATP